MDPKTLEELQGAIGRLVPADRARFAAWFADFHDSPGIAEPLPAYGGRPESPILTVDEYLQREERSSIRHEYLNGVLHAMAGASERHELIAGNVFAAIHASLRGGPCRAYISNFKLRLRINDEDIFYYPDVMVGCGREGVETHFLRHPKLIVEVLSPSTQAIDRREKLVNYAQIPTLGEYVVVSQEEPKLAVHRRTSRWTPQWVAGVGEALQLGSLDLSLPLSRIYEGVAMPAASVPG